jgi:hypothetical protein
MALDKIILASDIASWAQDRINLSATRATEYREQGNRLRAKLEAYIDVHEDFDLVKMLNSGSVEKGTALRTKSDMDVGVYVKRAAAPEDTPDLVAWLRDRLADAYGDLVKPEQITIDNASVRLTFSSSGVPVECIPILYDGEADNYGDLLLRSGERVRTSISKHIEFFRTRKSRYPFTYAQYVRLLRFWGHQRYEEGRMPLTPFGIELIAAHLVDKGLNPEDYPDALQNFFSFIARGGLDSVISFSDNYPRSAIADDGKPVRVFDPVAPENNVTHNVNKEQLSILEEAAMDGLDDITIARTATTKLDVIKAWRGIFGPEFSA